MKKTKVAKAIAFAIAGAALTAGSVSTASATSTTMYNLTTGGGVDNTSTVACAPCNPGSTDGWVWGFTGAPLTSTTSVAQWAGTGGANTTPFGYNGGGTLNWALHSTAFGDTAVISSQDSVNRYGIGADIDTAKGAWSDAALGGAAGWRHDLDFGLFMSAVDAPVTLSASGINQSGTNFGFTIFEGADTSTGIYNHHGAWNNGNNTAGLTAASLPGGGRNLPLSSIVAYSVGGATPSNLNTIKFDAKAGQVYTIALGGYKNGAWGDTTDGYRLDVTVPEPSAVLLIGSAMAGLFGFRRRKAIAPLKIA